MQAIPTGTPGVSSLGLVKIRTNEALEAEKTTAATPSTQRIVDSLTSHLNGKLFASKRAKEPIERQMLKNMRQVYGQYEPEKLAAIRNMGGSEVYILLTMTKYRAAIAWVNDILRPVGDRPWTIAPTPKADLPPTAEQQIKAEGQLLLQTVMKQLAAMGQNADPSYLQSKIQKFEQEVRDDVQQNIQKEAKVRAERMAIKIDDQMT
ncbi:MAG TPA: hypothetical protein DCS05_09005, partial [Nitrospiraceae bacterium]|nr:hypothetical protein [Nitrospiraceae bacterium]